MFCQNILSISLISVSNMRAIMTQAHVIRTSSRSYRIFTTRRFLKYQETSQTREGIEYACGGDHRPWHNVWSDRLL